MNMRNVAAATVLGLGLFAAGAAPAIAAPSAQLKGNITAGCEIEGQTAFVDLLAQGAVAFVLDAEGNRTGDKFFLVSVDSAAFNDEGELVDEVNRTYGKRRGHGEPFFCAGSFVPEPGITVFFDAQMTNP